MLALKDAVYVKSSLKVKKRIIRAMQNLFNTSNLETDSEQFNSLIDNNSVKLERIVSFGIATPKGEWYDQDQTEWVALIQGRATIKYKDNTQIELQAGDTLLLKPHVKHRVEEVSKDAIWLALFLK